MPIQLTCPVCRRRLRRYHSVKQPATCPDHTWGDRYCPGSRRPCAEATELEQRDAAATINGSKRYKR
jgi:hypothetical protein